MSDQPQRVPHPSSPPDIPSLLDVLHRHGVRYVLTGSVAAQLYGADIGQPGDLDITPALDAENLTRLVAALRDMEAGLDPDAPTGHWETRDDGERKWIVDAVTPELRAMRADWRPDPADPDSFDSSFCSRLGNFDIVPNLSGAYEALMTRAVPMSACTHTVWVVHIDDLLAALTVPRRQKDAPRVRQLRALQRQRGERGRLKSGEEGDA